MRDSVCLPYYISATLKNFKTCKAQKVLHLSLLWMKRYQGFHGLNNDGVIAPNNKVT